jgi:hypothetical protein
MCKQKPYIEVGQTIKWPKEKWPKEKWTKRTKRQTMTYKTLNIKIGQ